MINPCQISRKLYPSGIDVYRVKSDGIYTVVQYEYEGKRYHSVNNLEKVLHTVQVNAFWPCCFYKGDLLVVYGYQVRKSDPFLIFQQPFLELSPQTSRPTTTDTGFQYDDVEPTVERVLDITVDYDTDCNELNLIVAFEDFINIYPLYSQYFSLALPKETLSFKGKKLFSVHSLSTKFALFYDLVPPLNEQRIVNPTNNVTDPPQRVVDGELVLTSENANELDTYQVWNRLMVTYDNHSRAFLYDLERKETLTDYPLGPFSQYILITEKTIDRSALTYTITTTITKVLQDIRYNVQIVTSTNNIVVQTSVLPTTVDVDGNSYLAVSETYDSKHNVVSRTVTPSNSTLETSFTLQVPYNETYTTPGTHAVYSHQPQFPGADAILLTRTLKAGINPSISDTEIVLTSNISDFLVDLSKDPLIFQTNNIRFIVPNVINTILRDFINTANKTFTDHNTDIVATLESVPDSITDGQLIQGGWFLVYRGTDFTRLAPDVIHNITATLIPIVNPSKPPQVSTTTQPVTVDSVGNVYLVLTPQPSDSPIIAVSKTYGDNTHTVGLSTSFNQRYNFSDFTKQGYSDVSIVLNTISIKQPIAVETSQQITTVDGAGNSYFTVTNNNNTLTTIPNSTPSNISQFVNLNKTYSTDANYTSLDFTEHVSITVSLINSVKKNQKTDYFYFPHRVYNPWHNLSIFKGNYTEKYDYSTGEWTQQYTDVTGTFDWRSKIFDLTTDAVDNDGVFTRSSVLNEGTPHHISITISNVNLLNHFYLIFRIVVTDEFNAPVSFARVGTEVVAGTTDGQALRYFDPSFYGVPNNTDLTDVNGVAFILLRTANGDFPEQLQGHWAFSITVTKNNPMSMDDAILFQGHTPTEDIDIIKDMMKSSDELDFLRCRKQFHFDM